jgi:hypothetical protein
MEVVTVLEVDSVVELDDASVVLDVEASESNDVTFSVSVSLELVSSGSSVESEDSVVCVSSGDSVDSVSSGDSVASVSSGDSVVCMSSVGALSCGSCVEETFEVVTEVELELSLQPSRLSPKYSTMQPRKMDNIIMGEKDHLR